MERNLDGPSVEIDKGFAGILYFVMDAVTVVAVATCTSALITGLRWYWVVG